MGPGSGSCGTGPCGLGACSFAGMARYGAFVVAAGSAAIVPPQRTASPT